jgi:RNA polymerase sigma-70 factor (ECF subfamily)
VGPEQLGQLIDRHAASLALYARHWCSVPEDVVQEAFVKLAGQRPAPTDPVAWLYRVVRNGAISAGRSARRRRQREAEAATQRGAASWFLAADPGLPEVAETATAALRDLPDEQRESIVAHLWGGLTFAQIADLLGSSPSTVHRWYLAGLARLRERMGVSCPNETMAEK